MKKIYLIGWDNAMLTDTYKKAHAAYLDAFTAIKSPKADSWTLEDTKSMQGTAPATIWANVDLWGEQGDEAKKAFYESINAQPILPLREGAKALLTALHVQRHEVYIVSNKTTSILNYEICELGIADDIQAAIGFDGTPRTKVELLEAAMEEANAEADEVILVANAGYEAAAAELGIEFIEASTEAFKKIFQSIWE